MHLQVCDQGEACDFLGAKLNNKGTVVEFEGDLASINGRDRSTAFGDCMKQNYPAIKVLAEETNWKGDVASAKLRWLATVSSTPVPA